MIFRGRWHIRLARHGSVLTWLRSGAVLCTEAKPGRDGEDYDCAQTDPHRATMRSRGSYVLVCNLHGFTFHGRLVPTACSRAMRAAYASSNMSVYPVSTSM